MNIIKVKLCVEIINHNLIKRITTHPFGAPNPFPFLSIKESGMPERKRKKIYSSQMRGKEEFVPQVSNLNGCWSLQFSLLLGENTQQCVGSLRAHYHAQARGLASLLGTTDTLKLSPWQSEMVLLY